MEGGSYKKENRIENRADEFEPKRQLLMMEEKRR
jgi:hypothetical protein